MFPPQAGAQSLLTPGSYCFARSGIWALSRGLPDPAAMPRWGRVLASKPFPAEGPLCVRFLVEEGQ
jgi:hypothetical protein